MELFYPMWLDQQFHLQSVQKYYGLTVDGIVDQATWDKINDILNSPFQNGKRHDDTIKLKKDLAVLGFGVSSNPTNLYGSATERTVKELQEYYGLVPNGIADEVTLAKIDSILNSPFRNGERHDDTIKLKTDLDILGFTVSSNPTDLYGAATERTVRTFQEYYGLVPNGIADEVTLAKIDSILNSPFRKGKEDSRTIQLKKDLEKIGLKVSSNPTSLYGSKTEQVVKELQRTYGLVVNGIADEVTLAKIEELLKGVSYTQYNLTIEQAVEIQMNQKAQTDKKEYAWVSKNYIDSNNKVTANALNVRTQPTTKNEMGNKILGTLSKGTRVDIVGEKGNWYAIKYSNNNWVQIGRAHV